MLHLIIILAISGHIVAWSGSKAETSNEPSKGEVWPKLQEEKRKEDFYVYPGNDIQIVSVNSYCNLLKKAEQRFKEKLRKLHSYVTKKRFIKNPLNKGFLEKIVLNLTEPCEEKPSWNMEEYYELYVTSTTTIISKTVWGIMRALESLIQLFYIENKMLIINENQVKDYPHYKHRGLMLDTARNYISMENILIILDAMAMNKMNVFHWHLSDDESFPYESKTYPELSRDAAFSPDKVYNASVVKEIIEYALVRGIRVIPEFDLPAHTRAIAHSHPELINQCIRGDKLHGQMKVFGNFVYDFLRHFLFEIQTAFLDECIHLGGNDVDMQCWKSNDNFVKDFTALLKSFGMGLTYGDLPVFIHSVLQTIMNEINGISTKMMVWQDVIETIDTKIFLIAFRKELFVQIYKRPIPNLYEFQRMYKIIFSVPWDLSNDNNTFEMMYANPPYQWNTSVTWGGEALMWTQNINDSNVISRMWARASAAAEILWNSELVRRVVTLPASVSSRIDEHTCRMRKLGVPAESVTGSLVCENEGHKASNDKSHKTSDNKGHKTRDVKGHNTSYDEGYKTFDDKGHKILNAKNHKTSNDEGQKTSNDLKFFGSNIDRTSNDEGRKSFDDKEQRTSNNEGFTSANGKERRVSISNETVRNILTDKRQGILGDGGLKTSDDKGVKSANDVGYKSFDDKGKKISNNKGLTFSDDKKHRISNDRVYKVSDDNGQHTLNDGSLKISDDKVFKAANEEGQNANDEKDQRTSNDKDPYLNAAADAR